MKSERIRVLCVDDNLLVAEGVRIKLMMAGGFEWAGHLLNAESLVSRVQDGKPDVVLLDIDMPGPDALAALEHLSQNAPGVRTIILSGYAREDYLDRAVESGAWGYVSKNDGPDQVVDAIRRVANGQFAFGPSVLQHCTEANSTS